MNVKEHKEAARKLLKDADREFVLGSDLKASEMMWDAVSHAIAAVAEQRGWPFGDNRAVKEAGWRISDELNVAGFSAAELFHDHITIDFLEEYELEPLYQDVCSFVYKMLALVE